MTAKVTPGDTERTLAESHGFTAILDPARGSTWCKYEKAGWHVWSLGYSWAVAELVDGRFRNHHYAKGLEPCLKFVTAVIRLRVDAIESASLMHAMRLKPLRFNPERY